MIGDNPVFARVTFGPIGIASPAGIGYGDTLAQVTLTWTFIVFDAVGGA